MRSGLEPKVVPVVPVVPIADFLQHAHVTLLDLQRRQYLLEAVDTEWPRITKGKSITWGSWKTRAWALRAALAIAVWFVSLAASMQWVVGPGFGAMDWKFPTLTAISAAVVVMSLVALDARSRKHWLTVVAAIAGIALAAGTWAMQGNA